MTTRPVISMRSMMIILWMSSFSRRIAEKAMMIAMKATAMPMV